MDPFFHIWSHSQQNVTNLDLNSCGMVFVKLGNEDDISSWIFFCFVVRLELNCFYFVLIYELCQASNNRTIHCLKGTNIPSFPHSFKPQQSKTIHLQLNWKIMMHCIVVSFFLDLLQFGKGNARNFAKSSSQLVFFPPKKVATSQAPHRIIDTLLFLIVIICKAMKLSASVPKPILLKHNKPKLSLLVFSPTHNSDGVPIILVLGAILVTLT